MIKVDLEGLGHHLRNFGKETLAHLRAAVIQQNAAIGIDVHKGAGLIERRAVE